MKPLCFSVALPLIDWWRRKGGECWPSLLFGIIYPCSGSVWCKIKISALHLPAFNLSGHILFLSHSYLILISFIFYSWLFSSQWCITYKWLEKKVTKWKIVLPSTDNLPSCDSWKLVTFFVLVCFDKYRLIWIHLNWLNPMLPSCENCPRTCQNKFSPQPPLSSRRYSPLGIVFV